MKTYDLHEGFDFTGMVESKDGGFYSCVEVDKLIPKKGSLAWALMKTDHYTSDIYRVVWEGATLWDVLLDSGDESSPLNMIDLKHDIKHCKDWEVRGES